MSELKNFDYKLIEKLENVVSVKQLRDSYEKEEIKFEGELGETYKKVKYATDEEINYCDRIIELLQKNKKDSRI
jgi:hypothetical protein